MYTRACKFMSTAKQIITIFCEKCSHNNEVEISSKTSVSVPTKAFKFPRMKEKKTKTKTNTNTSIDNNTSDIMTIPNVTFSKPPINFPLCVEVKHRGFWITNADGVHIPTLDTSCDRNSVMFTPDCLLYVYKLALRHLLLSTGIITPRNIDPQNLVPHMVVRKNKSDITSHAAIQNKKYIITPDKISIKNDFMLIEVDEAEDLHYTLIFNKKIKERVDLMKAFKTVVSVLNEYPELIEKYSNLPYFGNSCIKYWHEVPDSYPFGIELPENYISAKPSEMAFPKTTAAGTIV